MPNTPPFEALELVPLCSATIKVHSTAILENTPTGHLMIGEIEESTGIGERFSAHQRGRTAADWLTVTPDGVALVDVRLTLETTEGGLIFVEYTGRTNMQTAGLDQRQRDLQIGQALLDPGNDAFRKIIAGGDQALVRAAKGFGAPPEGL